MEMVPGMAGVLLRKKNYVANNMIIWHSLCNDLKPVLYTCSALKISAELGKVLCASNPSTKVGGRGWLSLR